MPSEMSDDVMRQTLESVCSWLKTMEAETCDVSDLKSEFDDIGYRMEELVEQSADYGGIEAIVQEMSTERVKILFQLKKLMEKKSAANLDFKNDELLKENMKLLQELGALKATLPVLHSKAATLLRENAQLKLKAKVAEYEAKFCPCAEENNGK